MASSGIVHSTEFGVRGGVSFPLFPRGVIFCASPWVCSFWSVETVVGDVCARNIFVSFLVEEVVFLREGPGSTPKVRVAEDNEPSAIAFGRVSVDEEVEDGKEGKYHQGQAIGDLVGGELKGGTVVVVLCVDLVAVVGAGLVAGHVVGVFSWDG